MTVSTRARRLLLYQICLLAVASSPRVVGWGVCRHLLFLGACPMTPPHTWYGTAGLVTPPRPNRRSPDLDARCKSPKGAARAPAKEKPRRRRSIERRGPGDAGVEGERARVHRRSARAAPLASMIRQDAQADDARKPSGLGRRHTVAAQSVTARREKAPPTSRLGHRRKNVTEKLQQI